MTPHETAIQTYNAVTEGFARKFDTLGPQVVYRYTFADVITLTHQAYTCATYGSRRSEERTG